MACCSRIWDLTQTDYAQIQSNVTCSLACKERCTSVCVAAGNDLFLRVKHYSFFISGLESINAKYSDRVTSQL